ncbi:hypothetical protein NDU88_009074 [Pleurodeles waltl]|uniref:Uncharacterized protein n=1 Tax=Pleurodeles waltl TaxID=8319 RepID=A0AAV7NY62_PLEWA|nr:hypothetical protein NDU88_009074 [Pleurodeles waltl]
MGAGPPPQDCLYPTEEAEQAFKQAVSRTPALDVLIYSKLFTLFCHEKGCFSLVVLTQMSADKHHKVPYYSKALDL